MIHMTIGSPGAPAAAELPPPPSPANRAEGQRPQTRVDQVRQKSEAVRQRIVEAKEKSEKPKSERVVKIDRYIYSEGQRANGDIDTAMQNMQDHLQNGDLDAIYTENMINNPARFRTICRAAGIEPRDVASYMEAVGLGNLKGDNLSAAQIVIFKEFLQQNLQNRDYVESQYNAMHSRMTNTNTQERFLSLFQRELTIDNLIPLEQQLPTLQTRPRANMVREKEIEEDALPSGTAEEVQQIDATLAEITQPADTAEITVDGKHTITLDNILQYSDTQLAQAIFESIRTRNNPTTLVNQQTAITRASQDVQHLIRTAPDDRASHTLAMQQVKLMKLSRGYEQAIRLYNQSNTEEPQLQRAA